LQIKLRDKNKKEIEDFEQEKEKNRLKSGKMMQDTYRLQKERDEKLLANKLKLQREQDAIDR